MKEEYKEAFSEVEQIFRLMPLELLNKIPRKFREVISENKSNSYKPCIQEPFENCNLKYETHVILALIYRDFLCTEEEREELLKRDKSKLLEFEQEIREKYNPDTIFSKRNNLLQDKSEDTAENISNETVMVKYKEKNFIQKIFDKIKYLFAKK